jgi:iron complex transport system substrate-binding protein
MRKLASLTLVLLASTAGVIAEDTFPVTITTALGQAVIPEKPERVVAWGWSAQDVALDLGVVPVGMPFFQYGGGEDGVLPWTEAKIAEMGAQMPVVLPNTTEPPIEAIAALEPDVIIAPYSGLTQEEYDLLSNIAPVVAYPESRWFATWQQVVELTGAALGLSQEADALVAETESFMRGEAAAYPEIQGAVFANVLNRTDGQVAVRMEKDPRVQLLVDLGMVPAARAEGSELVPNGISYLLSYENFDRIEADLLVTLFDSDEIADEFFSLSYIELAPLVEKGAYARLTGIEKTMAVSGAVTPLSLRWGFPEYIKAVGEAAKVARQ